MDVLLETERLWVEFMDGEYAFNVCSDWQGLPLLTKECVVLWTSPLRLGCHITLRYLKYTMVLPGINNWSNAEEAEVEWFYEDLQDLLELTPQKDVLFIIGDWNAKVGSQETPGVTGKFGLGIWNEAVQRLIEFCQENALVIANTLFQQHKRRLYTWT